LSLRLPRPLPSQTASYSRLAWSTDARERAGKCGAHRSRPLLPLTKCLISATKASATAQFRL
jgi:hypothetical protein